MWHPRHDRRRKAAGAKISCALLLLSTQCRVDATIDVPAQLHQLQLHNSASRGNGDNAAPQVVLSNIPDSLFRRLSEKSVRWDSLSGYLQRALLWDAGLVMTSGGRLIQVYVPCDEDMSVILTTFEAFRGQDCPLETCDSTMLYFAGSTCSRSTVWKAAQCGIHTSEKNATDIVDAESSTLWSEDGRLSSVPDIRLYKHVLGSSSGSNDIEGVVGSGSTGNYTIEVDVLFTINQLEPLPSSIESCPSDPFFVAPCVQFRDLEESPENPWCLPKRGGFVDLWLDSEISGETMSSGSSATSATAFSDSVSTSISGDTVILVVLFILLAAAALAYLHGRQPIIIHRDLKSLNVLLDSRLRAKLSDFGLSRERSSDDTMTNGVGTLLWTAPEILRGEAYSEKADVYSYAIVLSELDTCLPPFTLNTEVSERRLTTMQLMHLATSGEVSPQLRDDCPASIQQLTAACASFEPCQRPNALEIVFTLRNIARNMKFDAAKSA
ncbi:hypothetical protein JG688_00002884 [Phytophthora aleatoria]|uniref:Protein kinase domain-containing protein n=1 Tax=Phytophthora aleatoria TaxID=2496075 RepID=A0A8J5MII8_9STRA|nr:hypothetical protein JG688_00002884 [Phytophthora aleatoria]